MPAAVKVRIDLTAGNGFTLLAALRPLQPHRRRRCCFFRVFFNYESMEDTKDVNKSQKSLTDDNFSSTANLTENTSTKNVEVAEYDPFAARDIPHPTSDAGALAHLLKCSLGTGILAMPNAFCNGGLSFGMLGTVLIGILCTHCVHILVKSSHMVCRKAQRPSLTFAETGEQAFATGPRPLRRFAGAARNFVNGALVATYYSALCVYVVFVAESIKQVVDFYSSCETRLDTRIWIGILVVPLAILCLIKDLKYLVPFSWIANTFIIIGFGLTLYFMFRDIKSPEGLPHVGKIGNLPLFFSTVIFAMEGIGVVMPVENNMKHPSHFLGCPGILNIAMFIVVTLYAVIGFFGYLAYREDTKASVTFNLPFDDVKAQIVKVLVGLAILFTYPLQFYVGTEIILKILKEKIRKEKFSLFQNAYRICVVATTVAIAAAVPNLGPIISLVGAICFSTLGLLVPAIIETAACYDGELGVFKWRLYKNILISIIATIALVFGTYASIIEIIAEYTKTGIKGPDDCNKVNGTIPMSFTT